MSRTCCYLWFFNLSLAQARSAAMAYLGLYKTQFCLHGQHHAMREYAYAHSLAEVRPPDLVYDSVITSIRHKSGFIPMHV